MKKVFIEPDMQRIELNLSENIASSTGGLGYYFHIEMFSCLLMNTGKYIWQGITDAEAASCLISTSRRSMGMMIPAEEVRPHLQR